jgi:hypothetical protein
MEVVFITKEDLDKFRKELLDEIKNVLRANELSYSREWLKAKEVRELLGISYGTLQNLRVKGILKGSKIGGIFYYRYDDIHKVLLKGTNQI